MTNQQKKTCYAQHRQVKTIRRKMIEIMNREINGCELKEVVTKLIPDTIADDIRKVCCSVYPLKDVYIRKVKVLKKPRFEASKLLELHGDAGKVVTTSGEDMGSSLDRPDNYEPPVLESV